MGDEQLALVFDMGSGEIKAGFAGDDFARACFRNVIGSPRYISVMNMGMRNNYVGDTSCQYKGTLALQYPIEHGVASNADAVEEMLQHTFDNELRVFSDEHNVMLTEPPFNPRSHRQLLNQLLFEKFNVPATYFVYPPLVSSWYGGRYSSLTVDIGEGVTSIMPMIEGRLIKSAVIRTNFAGRSLTNYMARLMTERGYYLNSPSDLETVRTMKEQVCYVPLDYNSELNKAAESSQFEKSVELRDGTPILFDSERFRCPEALFQPSLVGSEMPGIHHLIFESLNMLNMDHRKLLMCNIFLAGGSTLFPGFVDRLYQEMTSLAPANAKVKIVAPPERKHVTWMGGSMAATTRAMREMWITRREYDEYGPAIAFRKCLYI